MKTIKLDSPKLSEEFIKTLKSGGLVVFPTETCYGAGVIPTIKSAVDKLLEFKKRPPGKAISIACSTTQMAERYVEINEEAKKIYRNFLPGPVTVISKSKGVVDARLESELGTLGVRIPDYGILLNLIQELDLPITATSANQAGEKNPYNFQDITDHSSSKRLDMIDLFIDAGELPRSLPSTVIDTTTDQLQTYRHGAVVLDSTKAMQSFTTNSSDETIFQGKEFMQSLLKKKKLIILLSGELGAGKTQFTKGVAKALGITRNVKSPTYSYSEEYKVESAKFKKLFHIDAWKISTAQELELLELEELSNEDNVIVVEWPEIIINKGYLKFFEEFDIFRIRIEKVGGEQRRVEIFDFNTKKF